MPDAPAAQITALLRRQARLTSNCPTPLHYRAVLDEFLLHRTARSAATWAEQLDHLIGAARHPAVSLQILPVRTGPHPLRGALELLGFPDGRTFAYAHGTHSGHLVDDPDDVQPLRQSYDLLRDAALTPAQSLTHLGALRDDLG